MPIFVAYLLTDDLEGIQLYLWIGYDVCVIEEAQRRSGNGVKIEKLRMHQEPPR